MWTWVLKVWEATGGTAGALAIALVAYTAGLLRSTLRELRDAREDRADFKAQVGRLRDESKEQVGRLRDESKEQFDRLRDESKTQFDRLRDESNARADREHDEAKARADREHDEAKAQSREDRALHVRDHAQLSNAIADVSKVVAEQSKQIAALSRTVSEQSKEIVALSMASAEQSKQIAEQSKQIAAVSKAVSELQGDVRVLLDRSNRSSGGKGGTGHPATSYEIAHQAVPTPREEEDGEDE